MASASDLYRLLHVDSRASPLKSPPPHALKHKTCKLRPLPRPQSPFRPAPATNDHHGNDDEMRSPTKRPPYLLPQLETRVLQRRRVILNVDGPAEIGLEEIVQYNEVDAVRPVHPLALFLPKKCSTTDEIPLMPCFAKAHRCRLFDVEKWQEPIRDRDKAWGRDELSVIQAVRPQRYPMTDGRHHTKKWRSSRQDNEQRLNRRGVMIDLSYVIVTAIGVNIFGRVYGAGLQSKRSIVLNVYDPALALNHTMQLSMDDLENLFQDHMDLLAAGRKDDLVSGIVAMLYFKYPPEGADKSEKPTLHINKEMKISASKLRRQQRERQRQLEAEQRRLDALKFLTMARRQRYRILARSIKMGGLRFTVTVHHYPNQLRNFAIVAYHPVTGTQYSLPVGLHHAGKLARVLGPPHQWSKHEKVQVAATVVRHLRLVHNSVGETALGIDGRVGFFNTTLSLECAETTDTIAEKAFRQSVANAITLVQAACHKDVRELQTLIADIDARFAVELKELEAKRQDLRAKEAAVKDLLDDVESKGLGDVVDTTADKSTKAQQRQELRDRRQALKRERGDALNQLKATQQDITNVLSKQQAASAHYEADIKQRVLECELEVGAISAAASRPFQYHDKTSGERRNAKAGYTNGRRHKLEMGQTNKLVAGAAKMRDGHRVRYSVWQRDDSRLEFRLYIPHTSQTVTFVCSKLAWCVWSKESSRGDDLWSIQKEIPGFVVYPQGGGDPIELELMLAALATELEAQHAKYGAVATQYSREATKGFEELKALYNDKMTAHRRIRQLYHPLAAALVHRLSVGPNGDGNVNVNSLLFDLRHADIVTSRGDSKACSCQIHLDGSQIVYKVDSIWTRVHPYTDELMAEFATESAVEMKVHMELTTATMQLTYPEADGGRDDASGVVIDFID